MLHGTHRVLSTSSADLSSTFEPSLLQQHQRHSRTSMDEETTTNSLNRDQSLELQEEKQPPSMSSTPQDSEKDTQKPPQQRITGGEHEYITGFQFVIVMVSVTMVIFLMLLDVAIIVTVKTPIKNYP